MADLEVDGVRLHDVSPGAWRWLRSGLVESGERRWMTQQGALRAVTHGGWHRLGRDPRTKQVLVWRPVPALPADPVRSVRESRGFGCARCGRVNPDYLSFGVGGGGGPSERYYCLHHIPRRVRLAMWLRGLVRRG